jgi:hypothetical protein
MPRFVRLAALLLACIPLSAKTYVAERYDVRIVVLPDASLAVTEAVRFAFHGGDFSFVTRDISKRGLDRIVEISATLDGQPADAEISNRARNVHVRWRFHATDGSAHVFVLAYRVLGAIREDRLDWRAIPEQHAYAIETGEIELEAPQGVLAAPPEATYTATAERSRSGARFVLVPVPSDRPVFVRADFRSGFAPSTPPLPGFPWTLAFGAGALTLVAAALLLSRARSELAPNVAIPPPPLDPEKVVSRHSPGFAYRLAGGATGPHGAIATLLDLARRGAVAIRAGERRRFGRAAHFIEPRDLHRPFTSFEAAVLDIARPPARFDEFLGRLSRRYNEFHARVEEQMVLLDLLDPERLRLRRRWSLWAAWLLLPGIVLATFAAVLANASELAPALLAVAAGLGTGLAAAGIATAIAAVRTSILTPRGAEAASAFRAVRDILIALSRRKLTAAPADFERWLPVAVALGIGSRWVARFRGEADVPMPEWFSGDTSSVSDFAFFDFAADAGSSASAAAGGDGGGGSGGGSSAAG